MADNKGFPNKLLDRSIKERIDYFHNFTIAHPLLVQTTQKVVDTIKNPSGYSLFMVMGPTGVGKSTLFKKVIKIIIEELLTELEKDKSFIPIAGIEIVSPDSGNFNWKDYYKRVLECLNEPLIDYKIDYNKITNLTTQKDTYMASNNRSTAPVLRKSLENAFHYRKTTAFLIDEAQHFAKMVSAKRLQDQLDTIKSISNITNVIHVLIGTYELVPFINLSGQLSRRTIDIHFPRYKADRREDLQVFNSVLNTFESQMPLEKESNLIQYWNFIYERTIGCVGILKNWLERCLDEALLQNYKTISYELLKKHALSLSKVEKIAIEAIEGEAVFEEDKEKKKRLYHILGIENINNEENTTVENNKNASKNKRKHSVGQRKPSRDEVGVLGNAEG